MGRAAGIVALAGLACGPVAPAAEPELIERLNGAIDDHALVMLEGEEALVAWERDDGPADETVWASHRTAPGRWSVPEIVEFSQGHAHGVRVASDGMGRGVVLWIQQELGLDGLWENRYTADHGWRQPVRIEPVAGELYAPSLAFDARGGAIALWERRVERRLRIRSSAYRPESGWSRPREIDAGGGDAVAPRLAVHSTGASVAVWSQREPGAHSRILGARFTPATGWGTPVAVSPPGGDAYDVRLGMDAAGHAIAAWEQELEGEETVFASRLAGGDGWGPPVRLEVEDEEGYGPRLAVAPDGGAVVAWIRAEGEVGTVAAARFTPRRGWEPPVTVQGGPLLYMFDLDIAAGTDGGALAAWIQTDASRNNVWLARFDPVSGWDAPALAERRTGSAHAPRIAAAPAGGFGIVWKSVDAPLPEQALFNLWFLRVP